MHQWGKYRLLSGCGITEELYRKRKTESVPNLIELNSTMTPQKNFFIYYGNKETNCKNGQRDINSS